MIKDKKSFKKKIKEACEDVTSQVDASILPALTIIKNKKVAGVPFYVWDLIIGMSCVIAFIAIPYFWIRSILLILAIYGIVGAYLDFKAYNKLRKSDKK